MTARPRQRDIARLAGVSQTTVSLTLNGKTAEHGINKQTEQKIMSAARELGYVPNVTARALRGGRNGLIGVHAFESLFPTGATSYYDEFLVGIEQQAIEFRQDLVLFTSLQQHDESANIFHGGRNRLRIADGAIILGISQHDDELARLAADGFAFVYIGRRELASALMPYVTADYRSGVADVMAHVHRHGHARVAYLGMADTAEPRIERRDSFHDACAGIGLDIVDKTLAVPGSLGPDWLDGVLDGGATALIVENTTFLEEVAALGDSRGVPIPGRLSVVGLDSINEVIPTSRAWTHLDVPRREIGARALSLLLEVLDGEHELSHHERLACRFVAGATLRPPAGAGTA